jgi:alpha-1,2-mannosyltransferase
MLPRVLPVVAVGLVAAAFGVRGVLAFVHHLPEGGDTAVYQAGASALLHGQPLYDSDTLPSEPAYAQLPFTYAPFAALLFIPLAFFPVQIAWGLLGVLSDLALAGVAYLVLRKVARRPAWLSPGLGATVVFGATQVTEPVTATVGYGQINAVLMALVVLDVLVVCGAAGRLGRFGGVLIGVAAAIKLTPLIFVVHLLLTGRKADAARAAGTFVGLQGLMLLISPHDTIRFWTHTVYDSSRIGPTSWSYNQSLGSLVRRLADSASWSQPLAYGIGAVLAVCAAVLVLRFHRRDRPVHAMLVTAFLALLISPVSWVHHWVWIVPLLALLLPEALSGNRFAQVLAPLTLVVFIQRPLHSITPGEHGEASLNVLTFVLSNLYVLFPIAVGLVFLLRGRIQPEVGSSLTQR